MDEIRVDLRMLTPEEMSEGVRQAQVLFRLNQTMPYTEEYDLLVKELFGDHIGAGVRIMPGLTGVCFHHVKIGDGALIMNNCLMMSLTR